MNEPNKENGSGRSATVQEERQGGGAAHHSEDINTAPQDSREPA